MKYKFIDLTIYTNTWRFIMTNQWSTRLAASLDHQANINLEWINISYEIE